MYQSTERSHPFRLKKKKWFYCIKCKDCNYKYIGKIKRQFKTRIQEHKTNIKRQPEQLSIVSTHRLDLDHDFNWNDVSILDEETYYYKRIISECLHIQSNRGTINIASDTELLSPCYLPLRKTIYIQHVMN